MRQLRDIMRRYKVDLKTAVKIRNRAQKFRIPIHAAYKDLFEKAK